MKYLIYFLPSLALANFVSEGGKVTYADKAMCEQKEKAECFALPLDAEVKSLQLVEVPDLEKPILDIKEPVNGVCTEPYLLNDKNQCQLITGYATKQEKQFVDDPVKIADKLAKENAEQLAKEQCEQFKTLLADSAINDKSTDKDVMEVTRRLLGYWKSCRR